MTKRKQTPDVLAEILGGDAAEIRPGKPESLDGIKEGQRWRYTLVSLQDYRGLRPRYIDGVEQKQWMNGPMIQDFLLDMGAEGWELVAATSGESMFGTSDRYQLFFKRPAED